MVGTMKNPGLKKGIGSLGPDSFQWPKLDAEEKQRFSGRKKGGAPFIRLPFERVDQPGQDASFAFHFRGTITALTTPHPGVEQVPDGIAEHIDSINHRHQAKTGYHG